MSCRDRAKSTCTLPRLYGPPCLTRQAKERAGDPLLDASLKAPEAGAASTRRGRRRSEGRSSPASDSAPSEFRSETWPRRGQRCPPQRSPSLDRVSAGRPPRSPRSLRTPGTRPSRACHLVKGVQFYPPLGDERQPARVVALCEQGRARRNAARRRRGQDVVEGCGVEPLEELDPLQERVVAAAREPTPAIQPRRAFFAPAQRRVRAPVIDSIATSLASVPYERGPYACNRSSRSPETQRTSSLPAARDPDLAFIAVGVVAGWGSWSGCTTCSPVLPDLCEGPYDWPRIPVPARSDDTVSG